MISEKAKKVLFRMYDDARDSLIGEHPWDDGYDSKQEKVWLFREIISELGLWKEKAEYDDEG